MDKTFQKLVVTTIILALINSVMLGFNLARIWYGF